MLKPLCPNDHHNYNGRLYTTKPTCRYTKPTHATTVSTTNAPYAKLNLNGATRYADSLVDICSTHTVTANTAVLDDVQGRTRKSLARAVVAVET